MVDDHPISRRAVMRAMGAGGMLVAASALTTAGQVSMASPANAVSGILVLSAAGMGTSTFDPPISVNPQMTTATIRTVFSPGEPCSDDPTLELVQDDLVVKFSANSCTSVPVVDSGEGVLTWSDGTQSCYKFDVTMATVIRVNGHAVGKHSGTIDCDAPHYAGAQITRLGLREADDVTACLTGATVPSAIGRDLVTIVL